MGKAYSICMLVFISALPVDGIAAQDIPIPPPDCRVDPSGSQVTFFGDSRAVGLVQEGELKNAHVDNVRILAPGSISQIQDLAWGGSSASDEPSLDIDGLHALTAFAYWSIVGAFVPPLGFLFAIVSTPTLLKALDKLGRYRKPDGQNWNNQFITCIGQSLPYRTTPHVVVNLGGNDMLRFHEYMEAREGLLIFFRAILDPKGFVQSVLGGSDPARGLAMLFWFWEFNAKEDTIIEGLRNVAYYHLNNLTGRRTSRAVGPSVTVAGSGRLTRTCT